MDSGYLFCFTGFLDRIFCLCERTLYMIRWNVPHAAGELLPQLPEVCASTHDVQILCEPYYDLRTFVG